MARTDPQVNIRMPQELKVRLEESTKDSGRSLNAEIIARLEQSFSGETDATILRLLGRLELQLAEADMLSAMSDINIALLAEFLADALGHIAKNTKPTKEELKKWRSELADYQDFTVDELEDRFKNTADRLADARTKLKLPPGKHKFGVYNK